LISPDATLLITKLKWTFSEEPQKALQKSLCQEFFTGRIWHLRAFVKHVHSTGKGFQHQSIWTVPQGLGKRKLPRRNAEGIGNVMKEPSLPADRTASSLRCIS
jgi:hypothetical protein